MAHTDTEHTSMENNEVTQQEEVISQEAQQEDTVLPEVATEPAAQAQPAAQPAAQPTVRPNTQEYNMREMRASKERTEREKAQLEQRLARYEQQANKKEEEPLAYEDDDFVEGKHLRKEIASLRKQQDEFKQQQAATQEESRLKQRYSDFDKVVTNETIARLKEEDPDFAETIACSRGSLYARGSSTYKKIKELGLYVEDKYEKDRALAQQNASKPRPVNSVSPQRGDNPLSMANAYAGGLTPELKKQLWKETQDAIRRS
jgi:hypothetical protein